MLIHSPLPPTLCSCVSICVSGSVTGLRRLVASVTVRSAEPGPGVLGTPPPPPAPPPPPPPPPAPPAECAGVGTSLPPGAPSESMRSSSPAWAAASALSGVRVHGAGPGGEEGKVSGGGSR